MFKIPTTIFSGYLGSGKTTIILNSLSLFKEPHNFALIKNEFGDVNVDAQLFKNQNLQVTEMVNGCLCCVLTGSLNPAIDELIAKLNPERIIIEASGNAYPFPIVLELKKNPQVYVDGVITVVDCVNFSGMKDKSVVARDQAKYTDLIIFNKVGMVDEDTLYRVKEDVYDVHPNVTSIETKDGFIEPHLLFGIPHDETDWKQLLETTLPHSHEHEVESFVFETNKAFNLSKLTEVLRACEPSRFYRIKGVVQTEAGWNLVNGVFGRIEVRLLEKPEGNMSRIVFIGKEIKKWEEMIGDYLDKARLA